MASLPIPSGRDVVKAIAKDGWQMARQRSSHKFLVKSGRMATLSVPDHQEVVRGALRSLIRSRGLTVEVFAALTGKKARQFPQSSPTSAADDGS